MSEAPDGFQPTVDDVDDVRPLHDHDDVETGLPSDLPTTGVASVDQVLRDLDGLDELPLDQHVGAFERAHESLRSALDAPAAPPPGDPA